MTYNVFGGTLNLSQPINLSRRKDEWQCVGMVYSQSELLYNILLAVVWLC